MNKCKIISFNSRTRLELEIEGDLHLSKEPYVLMSEKEYNQALMRLSPNIDESDYITIKVKEGSYIIPPSE